ncbi:hypothetical protein G7Y89_g7246 [Cudoniella acicularis]|uniref:2EXR domain-containing protein n=1 Tax=Cudoniella acicularis TaxID=354080 RepID=A0A8H4RJQ9_9HELO|nr:hypothetical protein G7Y89_g7246 [Cudoniella acicularis]
MEPSIDVTLLAQLTISQASTAKPLTTFHLFRNLPQEIRLQIWEEALPGPRVVYIEPYRALTNICDRVWSNKNIEDDFESQGFFAPEDPSQKNLMQNFGPRSHSTPPALLLVCKESHEVASKFYTQTFTPSTIWFASDRDTVYLDAQTSYDIYWDKVAIAHLGKAKVERVAIGFCDSVPLHDVPWTLNKRLLQPDEIEEPFWIDILSWFSFPRTLEIAYELNEGGDKGDLTLMEFCDVYTSLEYYSRDYDPQREKQMYDDQRGLDEDFGEEVKDIYASWGNARQNGLEKCPGYHSWDLPSIQFKTLTTNFRCELLEKAQMAYENEKALFGSEGVEKARPITRESLRRCRRRSLRRSRDLAKRRINYMKNYKPRTSSISYGAHQLRKDLKRISY